MLLGAITVVVKPVPVTVRETSDISTTILAVLGVVLALASLAWQAWSFRQSGSRVSVDLRTGSGTRRARPPSLRQRRLRLARCRGLAKQGFTDPVLAVEVTNSGRSPTNVVSVSILYENAASYTETHFDPSLPFRLDAESEKTWYFSRAQVAAYAQAMHQVLGSGPLSVRGSVAVGGKKKAIVSKNRVTL